MDLSKIRDKEALALVRAEFATNGNHLANAQRYAEELGHKVSYETVKQWHKNGFLDPNNHEAAMTLARHVGPETMIQIAEQAAGLTLAAQNRVAETIGDASAKDASQIAKQQYEILALASGQATSRVEFVSRSDLAEEVERLGLDEGYIDAEVVEHDAA